MQQLGQPEAVEVGSVRRLERQAALATGRILLGVVAVTLVLALVVSRRPDALSNPQFWAEDGRVWYEQAYNRGALPALLTPASGYMQTFSRLTAALSLAFDFADAPLVFNLAAIVAQALPPLLLLSSRFAHTIPDIRLRALAALLFVGLPNAFEIQSNVTNTQTHLALLALLIVLADPPRTRAWKAFDLTMVLLGGLAGPTCVLLVPVALLAWWVRRERWSLVVLAALLVPASVQAITYLTSASESRFTTPLGASVARLLQIVGGQVFFAGMLGVGAYRILMAADAAWADAATLFLGVAGLLLVARALLVTRILALRLFVLFAALALAMALVNPAISPPPRWQSLRVPDAGIRYYAPAILAYLAVLLWGASADPSRAFRLVSRVLVVLVLLVGLPRDWQVPARVDLDFPSQAARLAAAPAGTMVEIPIPPEGWSMRLRKR